MNSDDKLAGQELLETTRATRQPETKVRDIDSVNLVESVPKYAPVPTIVAPVFRNNHGDGKQPSGHFGIDTNDEQSSAPSTNFGKAPESKPKRKPPVTPEKATARRRLHIFLLIMVACLLSFFAALHDFTVRQGYHPPPLPSSPKDYIEQQLKSQSGFVRIPRGQYDNIITDDDLAPFETAIAQPLRFVSISGEKIDDRGLSHINRCRIESLHILDTNVENLSALKGMTISDLTLTKLPLLRHDAYNVIAGLPNLRELHLYKCPLSEADLSVFKDSKIHFLSLVKTNFSMDAIQGIKTLKWLDLSEDALKLSDYQKISEMGNIERLGLTETTPAEALQLYKMKNLKMLYIHRGSLSPSDLANLKSALPNCSVITSDYHSLRWDRDPETRNRFIERIRRLKY